MKNLVFVTSNQNKALEMSKILGVLVKQKSVNDLEEIQEMDLEKIVEHKAKQAYKVINKPVLVEDVGLYVKEWGGFPGPFIKWLEKTVGYDLFPKLLSKKNTVVWVCLLGIYDGKNMYFFKGETKGRVVSPDGEGLWGFDIIFIPQGSNQTYAELGPEEKRRTGARAKAARKLKAFLKKQ